MPNRETMGVFAHGGVLHVLWVAIWVLWRSIWMLWEAIWALWEWIWVLWAGGWGRPARRPAALAARKAVGPAW